MVDTINCQEAGVGSCQELGHLLQEELHKLLQGAPAPAPRVTTGPLQDRHWTTREFQELLGQEEGQEVGRRKVLLEVGCGVGNLVFPLLEEQQEGQGELYIYCCDFR